MIRWELLEPLSMGTSGALLLAAALACGGAVENAAGRSTLPAELTGEQSDPGRMDPWQRYARFEYQYRSSPAEDPEYNYASRYDGSAALVYPKHVRRDAAWEYVLLGRDFHALGQRGAASRAQWAALTLVRKTVASRPDRERIRQTAYRELAVIARESGQNEWAALLDLCANLVDAYLQSPKAREDQNSFSAVVTKLKEAEEEQRRAQAASDRQALFGAITAGLQQGQAMSMVQNNAQGAISLTLQNLQQTIDLSDTLSGQREQIEKLEQGRGDFLREFETVVANDVTEIEAGLSFVAREATFFMLGTGNPKPYLAVVRSWSAGRGRLLKRVADAEKSPGPPTVLALARELQAREIHAARHERRGEKGPAYSEEEDEQPGAAAAGLAPDPIGTFYEVTQGTEPDGHRYQGTLEVTHQGAVVHLRWDLGASGTVTGIAVPRDGKLYAGWSSNSAVAGVSVYDVDGGRLVGAWATMNSGEAVGEEVLEGSDTLGGQYKIASGKLPGSGQVYGGTVSIAPTSETFDVRWSIGADGYRGVGIRTGSVLVVGWAPGTAGAGVSVYDVTQESLKGVWAAPGSAQLGHEELRRIR